jgi:outer membrane protein assembly factor BamB
MSFRQLSTAIAFAFIAAAADWPQFRGPQSHGISPETGVPVRWSNSQNVKWKAALPGPGHSSPVIFGNRVFLTAYRPDRSITRFFSNRGQLVVMALDEATGKTIWEKDVPVSGIEELHSTNAPASPTPVTDGRSLYVYFGSKGLLAFDLNGNKQWELPLGPFPNEWGSASSPVLYGNVLLLNCDTDGDDFLIAVDKNTGKQIWRTSRNGATRAWPTPYVWNANGRDEIVVSGSTRVKAYDPKTGAELWTVDGLTQWVTPTPVSAHGLLYVASNGPGGNVVMAIRPGGRGNITKTHVAWRYTRAAPYSSSPVIVGDFLFGVKNGGVMLCLNARTGQEMWLERLPAQGAYYASPVAAEGRIYVISEDGDATVVAAKPKFEIIASNRMGERTMASPAISDGVLYIRTDTNLYAIAGR